MNPLFPDEPKESKHKPHAANDAGYTPDRQKTKRIGPGKINPAVELVRSKLNALYAQEPDAREEIEEVTHATRHRTKHQQFMYDLSTSGKPLAHIQQEWHNYYAQLPDDEKHEVWREFYETNNRTAATPASTAQQHSHHTASQQKHRQPAPANNHQPHAKPRVTASQHHIEQRPAYQKHVSAARDVLAKSRRQLMQKVQSRSRVQTKAKQHLKSLLVGLSFGTLAVLILLFSFLNEVVIARFIQPGGNAGDTPIILSTNGIAPSNDPEIIIPKINAQLPAVYNVPSTLEDTIQEALDDGIIHYPTTALPGEQGNAAFFGHSSNNIFNSGKYKFAFALLRNLVPGDIFYITYKGKLYTYRVYDKRVVNPDETWVLGNAPGKLATAALITCDPPGTTLKRLVVWGEQINPDPTENAKVQTPEPVQAQELPAQGPTLWGRFWNWITP